MRGMKEVDAEEETQGREDEDTMHLSDGEAPWGKDLVRTQWAYAVIQSINVTTTNTTLGLTYYKKMGSEEVVDLDTVKCVVGRIWDRNCWAIIDRSGVAVSDTD